jgi:hypothetical protein
MHRIFSPVCDIFPPIDLPLWLDRSMSTIGHNCGTVDVRSNKTRFPTAPMCDAQAQRVINSTVAPSQILRRLSLATGGSAAGSDDKQRRRQIASA